MRTQENSQLAFASQGITKVQPRRMFSLEISHLGWSANFEQRIGAGGRRCCSRGRGVLGIAFAIYRVGNG